jgi:hypothetical protein
MACCTDSRYAAASAGFRPLRPPRPPDDGRGDQYGIGQGSSSLVHAKSRKVTIGLALDPPGRTAGPPARGPDERRAHQRGARTNGGPTMTGAHQGRGPPERRVHQGGGRTNADCHGGARTNGARHASRASKASRAGCDRAAGGRQAGGGPWRKPRVLCTPTLRRAPAYPSVSAKNSSTRHLNWSVPARRPTFRGWCRPARRLACARLPRIRHQTGLVPRGVAPEVQQLTALLDP